MQIRIYLGRENNLYSKRHRHSEPNPGITAKVGFESQLAVPLPPLTGPEGPQLDAWKKPHGAVWRHQQELHQTQGAAPGSSEVVRSAPAPHCWVTNCSDR